MSSSIEDEHVEAPRRRPRWFSPALVGVILGGVAGLLVLPTPLPACAPPGASSEVVVRTFFERLGSSAATIEECWAPGRLMPDDLQAYLRASPPTTVTFVQAHEGRGQNSEILLAWETLLTWNGPPPGGWRADQARFIYLVRQNSPLRWIIIDTQPPLP